MAPSQIYLDYAAATPLDSRVRAVMQPYFTDQFYNPSSPYLAARAVKKDIEAARARAAHWLGARPNEVIFTAGATESVNVAIHGIMRAHPAGELLTLSIEHDAVLATARHYSHVVVPVLPTGLVDVAALARHITDRTVLLSIGLANSEIGTVQPLRDITALVRRVCAERVRAGNPSPLYVHTDASQVAGYADIHAARLGVDLMTLNAGKIYGPKQMGLLYVKAGTVLAPILTGGGQELGLRSGTQNVPGIIGMAAALDIAQTDRHEAVAKQTALRDQLQAALQAAVPEMVVNGHPKKRLPNNLHVSFPGIDGERLVMELDELGLQTATGSACAANKGTASHVLQAIGLAPELVQGSLRLTLGTPTKPQDIEQAASIIERAVHAGLR